MTANGWLQILLYLAIIFAITKPLGAFMARVFNRERTFLDPVARPIERLLYRLTGVDEAHDMRWTEYALCHAFVQRHFHGCFVFDRTDTASPAFGIRRSLQLWDTALCFQHRRFIHYQHELADITRVKPR